MSVGASAGCLLLAAAGLLSCGASARITFSLDGDDWEFQLSDPPLSGKISVPGAWESQGFGAETVQMRWQVLTGDNAKGQTGAIGVYQKALVNLSCPASAPQAMLCVDHGIHRTANFSIDGTSLGTHTGYLTPFEADISSHIGPASTPVLRVAVDGGRDPLSDPLMGAADEDTDGTGLGGWAGLNGHVSVQCRPKLRIDSGVGGVVPPHVTHTPISSGAIQPVNVTVKFVATGGTAVAQLEIKDKAGATVALVQAPKATWLEPSNVSLVALIHQAHVWCPEEPSELYTATVSLISEGSLIDSVSTRFGIRTVTTDGYNFILNGRPIFLAGYGDASVQMLFG